MQAVLKLPAGPTNPQTHLAHLLEQHIAKIVEQSQEGKILTSIPGIGPQAAATLIASIGTIANSECPAQ